MSILQIYGMLVVWFGLGFGYSILVNFHNTWKFTDFIFDTLFGPFAFLRYLNENE